MSAADSTTVSKLQHTVENRQLGWIQDIMMNASQMSTVLSVLRWELSKRKTLKTRSKQTQLSLKRIDTKWCHQKTNSYHLRYFPHLIAPHFETKENPKLCDEYSHDLEWQGPRVSGKSCCCCSCICCSYSCSCICCNQQMPRNMLVIWSTNKRVSGCAERFPLAHVWHLGGGVWRGGGRTTGHTWEWVGAKRDEGGKEESEGDGPFNDNTVSFCRMSLNWSSHFSLCRRLFSPSTNLPSFLSS